MSRPYTLGPRPEEFVPPSGDAIERPVRIEASLAELQKAAGYLKKIVESRQRRQEPKAGSAFIHRLVKMLESGIPLERRTVERRVEVRPTLDLDRRRGSNRRSESSSHVPLKADLVSQLKAIKALLGGERSPFGQYYAGAVAEHLIARLLKSSGYRVFYPPEGRETGRSADTGEATDWVVGLDQPGSSSALPRQFLLVQVKRVPFAKPAASLQFYPLDTRVEREQAREILIGPDRLTEAAPTGHSPLVRFTNPDQAASFAHSLDRLADTVQHHAAQVSGALILTDSTMFGNPDVSRQGRPMHFDDILGLPISPEGEIVTRAMREAIASHIDRWRVSHAWQPRV